MGKIENLCNFYNKNSKKEDKPFFSTILAGVLGLSLCISGVYSYHKVMQASYYPKREYNEAKKEYGTCMSKKEVRDNIENTNGIYLLGGVECMVGGMMLVRYILRNECDDDGGNDP